MNERWHPDMPHPSELTEAQQKAVADWWDKNDPTGDAYEFGDNPRYARKGNAAEEAAYNELRNNGCCGFMDVELECEDGTTLLYGFNYGH